MYRSLGVLLFATVCAPSWAQIVLNGDLETNTAFGCQYNLGNATFSSMMPNVVAYGGGNEMDIQLNGCNYGTPTPSGFYFVSLANSVAAAPGDEIYFEVSPAFTAGNTYTITWIEQANLEFHPQDPLEVGISDVAGTFGTLISTTLPPDNSWASRSVTFTPAFDAPFITFRNQMPSDAWNFIDNVRSDCVVQADLGNDTTLCTGASLLLDATTAGATSYQWQDLSTGTSMHVTAAGTYWVEVSNGVCTARDSIVVTMIDPSSVDLGNDTTLCTGAALTLDATAPGVSYLWSNGSTNATLTVSATGLYWSEVDNGGCAARDSITVTFGTPPAIDLGNDTLLCAGESLLLDATVPSGSYLWNDGSTNATLTVNASGTYRVDASDGVCTAEDSITIVFAPTFPLGFADSTLCAGETLTLDATTPGATYTWSDGSTAPTLDVTASGTYWVSAPTGTCTYADTVDVTFLQPPIVDLGNDTALCPYDELLLTVLPPGTVLWSDGSSGTALLAAAGATYWAELDAGVCTVRDSIVIGAIAVPVVDLGPDTAICSGEELTLDAALPGATYLWQDGSTAASFTTHTAGSYHVARTIDGCTGSDTLQLELGLPPVIDLGPDQLLCPGYEVALDASVPGATYRWSTGAITGSIVASRPDTFSVTVTLGPCTRGDTVVLFFDELACACPLYAPNAMTADGDGINDGFAPYMPCPAADWQLLIFDRWGASIFQSSDQVTRWDGTVSGKVVPDGVYTWLLKFRSLHGTQVREARGSLTVLH